MKRIIPLMLTLVSMYAIGQETNSTALKPERLATKHEVGFSAGYTTGVGISYRYYPKKVGIQITTAPIIGKEHTWLSLGTSLMYTINESRTTKFYFYYGNHILYQQDSYTNYSYESEVYEEYNDTYESFMYMTGLGCGIELTAWQRVGFNFNFGFGAGFEFAQENDDTNFWQINPVGGISIYYKL